MSVLKSFSFLPELGRLEKSVLYVGVPRVIAGYLSAANRGWWVLEFISSLNRILLENLACVTNYSFQRHGEKGGSFLLSVP
jgi:hypothetical protein